MILRCLVVSSYIVDVNVFNNFNKVIRNYSRRVAKYGGRRSKSLVPKVNPWCFVVADGLLLPYACACTCGRREGDY
jgi:hypothetical protein